MKNPRQLVLLLILIVASNLAISAQEQTLILFRHAEKDISPLADKKNPNLSEAGKQRAEKLLETLRVYKPLEIFSTIYNRTRATVTPLAIGLLVDFRLQIQIYDSSEQDDFAKTLLRSPTKCIAVAGHSNTIPLLANILLRDNKYKDLADTEYNKIWVIKIKKRGSKPYEIRDVKVIEY